MGEEEPGMEMLLPSPEIQKVSSPANSVCMYCMFP